MALKVVFAECDVDKSGTMNLKEFLALAETDGNPLAAQMMEFQMKMADGDGDKVLSVDEFITFNVENSKDDSDEDFNAKIDQWRKLAAKKRGDAA